MLSRIPGFVLSVLLAAPAGAAAPLPLQDADIDDDEHLEQLIEVLERRSELEDEPPAPRSDGRSPADVRWAGRTYRVGAFELAYVHDFSWLPPRSTILDEVRVELGFEGGTFTAPEFAGELRMLHLSAISDEDPIRLDDSALPIISDAIARALDARSPTGEGSFFVAVDDRHIHPTSGRDLRGFGLRPLRFRAEYTGVWRLIDSFRPQYVQEIDPRAYPDGDPRPAIAELMRDIRVDLVHTPSGYTAWRPAGMPGTSHLSMTLEEIAHRPAERYSDAAIQQVVLALRNALTQAPPDGPGLMGVVVRVPLAAGDTEPGELAIPIVTGVVEQIRTLGAGDRLPGAVGPARINHPLHRKIKDRSSVQPGDVLQRELIDEHVYLWRRHPGRRVDVAIAPGEQPYGVNLDYLVTENDPLLLYGQVSNTGTRQTERWRFRFGLLHNQLTGNDDILSLDYNTAEFSRTHAFNGSYEARVWDFDRLRWRVYGTWSEFDASEVGFSDLRFTGEMWQVGAEMIANIYQDGPLFVDAVGGARFMHAEIENFFFNFSILEGSADFIIPNLGLRLERATDVAVTQGSLMFEGSAGWFTDTGRSDLVPLGRPFPDNDWAVMRWNLGHAFYLEPVLNPRAWADPATWRSSTLAHEFSLNFRGQYAFDNRLIPHVTMVAGGMYSVRGYPESAVSGDTVLIGSAEYRFHLPRIFAPTPAPGEVLGQPFRWRAQYVYGQPDWDLILKGFVDAARNIHSDRREFESDNTLLSTGVGLELQIKRNVNLRLDWGYVLREVDDVANSGSNRIHFAATFMY